MPEQTVDAGKIANLRKLSDAFDKPHDHRIAARITITLWIPFAVSSA